LRNTTIYLKEDEIIGTGVSQSSESETGIWMKTWIINRTHDNWRENHHNTSCTRGVMVMMKAYPEYRKVEHKLYYARYMPAKNSEHQQARKSQVDIFQV
jgi:hypothetical protein